MKIDKSKIIFAKGGVGKRISKSTDVVIRSDDKNEILIIDLTEKTDIIISDENDGGN